MSFLWNGVVYPLLVTGLGAVIPLIANNLIGDRFWNFIMICSLCVICELFAIFYLGFNVHERIRIKEMVKHKFQKE